jgi:GT2 family glycosyltransferase
MPTPHASLVAVVVTFNRLAQLQTTLARLLETAPQHLTAIIVVDNACTDGTPACTSCACPKTAAARAGLRRECATPQPSLTPIGWS